MPDAERNHKPDDYISLVPGVVKLSVWNSCMQSSYLVMPIEVVNERPHSV